MTVDVTCELCALRENAERVDTIEAIRSKRLALAMLNSAGDAAAEISTEVNGCLTCLARLTVIYLNAYTGLLGHMAGGADEAATLIQRDLTRDLDEQ